MISKQNTMRCVSLNVCGYMYACIVCVYIWCVVCMYVCIYVCNRIYILYIYIYIYVCIIYMYVLYIYMCIYTYIYIYMRSHTYIHTCIDTHYTLHIYTHTNTRIHITTYIQTHASYYNLFWNHHIETSQLNQLTGFHKMRNTRARNLRTKSSEKVNKSGLKWH